MPGKVLITGKFSQRHIEKLRHLFPEVDFFYGEKLADISPVHLATVDVWVTYGTEVNEENLKLMPTLGWIQSLWAGVDGIPFNLLQEKGITLTNVRGIHGTPMAEYTMGVILALAKGFSQHLQNRRYKRWDRTVQMEQIYQKTLGIVGLGSIGREIAKKGKAFGMHTIGLNTSGKPVDGIDSVLPVSRMEKMLGLCDYVVVIVPLTETTRGMFGKDQFRAMKPDAYLINISRGQVVDEEALVKALQEKQIRGAALDVFQQEPLPETSPLWEMDNVFLTPHVAALSPEYVEMAFGVFGDNLVRYLSDEQLMNRIHLGREY